MTRWHWRSGVKPVVEFCCRQGDLGGGTTNNARAEQGQLAQRLVQAQTPPGYRKEIAVSHTCQHHGITLTLSGRIDGLWEQDGCLYLEEIKSTYHSRGSLPDDTFKVHQAQAIFYAAMLEEPVFETLMVRVTYFQLHDASVFYREQEFSRDEVLAFLARWSADYCLWLAAVTAHREQRDAWAHTLTFPFDAYRPGQRQLAVNAWRHLRDHRVAMLEAPTGAGKTVSMLFPALKRFCENERQRVFYLTAKNSGQRSVQQALDAMRTGTALFAITLTGRAHTCPCLKDNANNELPCERRQGYYSRRRAAMEKALHLGVINAGVMQSLAEEFRLCPHQLTMDLAEWADLVIGDINYVFDPFTRSSLGNAVDEHGILLVDEAHNLPERARAMYSPVLDSRSLIHLLDEPALPGSLQRALRKLARQCESPATLSSRGKKIPATEQSATLIPATGADKKGRLAISPEAEIQPDTEKNAPPAALQKALDTTIEQLRLWLDAQAVEHAQGSECWLNLLALRRAFDHWGDHYRLMYAPEQEAPAVQALCLDPGVFLAQDWLACAGALVFSGTLQPAGYFAEVLGLQRLPAPRQADVTIIGHALRDTRAVTALIPLPMTWQYRQKSLPTVTGFITAILQARPGRHLIAAASFDILQQLADALGEMPNGHPVYLQSAGSQESERTAFLNHFAAHTHCVALVISGGIFAEGIDLSDTPLDSVFQVGLPMPAPSEERKALQAYFDQLTGQGFDYTFRYPAIARTLQTCGRLLRKDGDRGLLLLIDARFCQPAYVHFLPEHWEKRRITQASEIALLAKALD